ncbi:MAG: presqualene diphosphate synthase HpnD [Thiobacillaceae bacterium]|jgi:phytoene synthase
MNADQYCQEKAAASGSSFYYSFLFLPPEKRRAITAFYALCRELDDAVDECTDPHVAQIKLAWWRTELDRLYQNQPQHPVTLALSSCIRAFDIPRELLDEIVDGMEMDLTQFRYHDFKSLQLYCYRVAGVVGEIAARIFGESRRDTVHYARDLGLAFQLTNIIRDVGEDARRNRVYLPQSELDEFGISIADIIHGRQSDAFQLLMQFQYERAVSFYDKALSRLPAEDRRNQRPGLAMAAIYRATLEEIRRGRFNVLRERTSLTPLRKLWLAWKTWVIEAA